MEFYLNTTDMFAIANLIMRTDGDRDHMAQSNLKCEQTQAIARYLREVATRWENTHPS